MRQSVYSFFFLLSLLFLTFRPVLIVAGATTLITQKPVRRCLPFSPETSGGSLQTWECKAHTRTRARRTHVVSVRWALTEPSHRLLFVPVIFFSSSSSSSLPPIGGVPRLCLITSAICYVNETVAMKSMLVGSFARRVESVSSATAKWCRQEGNEGGRRARRVISSTHTFCTRMHFTECCEWERKPQQIKRYCMYKQDRKISRHVRICTVVCCGPARDQLHRGIGI